MKDYVTHIRTYAIIDLRREPKVPQNLRNGTLWILPRLTQVFSIEELELGQA